jgi:hypothetical protein
MGIERTAFFMITAGWRLVRDGFSFDTSMELPLLEAGEIVIICTCRQELGTRASGMVFG